MPDVDGEGMLRHSECAPLPDAPEIRSRSPARRRTIAQPAVFLDRDGVIIENRPAYVKSWQEVRFLPGALAALRRLSRSEYVLVLATNQSAVGRGIISIDQAMHLNKRVVGEIEARGGRIDVSYLCFHRPDEGCECRKPAPGMLLRAAQERSLDLTCSYVIGDAATDIEAAGAAGVQGILVLTGRGREQLALLERDGRVNCPVEADLRGAVDYITSAKAGRGRPAARRSTAAEPLQWV